MAIRITAVAWVAWEEWVVWVAWEIWGHGNDVIGLGWF